MTNPFERYLSKEDKLQRQVMDYVANEYPNVYCIHVANLMKKESFLKDINLNIWEAKAGVPDVLIFKKNEFNSGLAIELKGYTTSLQRIN